MAMTMRLPKSSILGYAMCFLYISVGFVGAVLLLAFPTSQTFSNSQSPFRYLHRYFSMSSNHSNYNSDFNMSMMQKNDYRQRFKGLWDNLDPSIGLDMLVDARKYVIYRCGPGMLGCGGWADRVKGMIMTYIIANLTGRVFKIDHRDPECEITKILIPNKVDWRLPRPFHDVVVPDSPPPNTVVLDYFRHPNYIMPFHKINVSQLFNQRVQFVYMKANLDYMDQIKKTNVYPNRLAWMKNLRKDQIFSEIYRRIFRYSPDFENRLGDFLNKHLPTASHKLICAHIRMGRNPNIPQTYEAIRMQPEFLPNVWDFISRHSLTDQHKVFIMTDSNGTLNEAKLQDFSSRLISTPGNMLHIEYAKSKGEDARCQALEKVLFDQAVLMTCDTLLISKSGLSRMAAFVRGKDEGLYCLFPWGNITKCAADQFTQLYHIFG